MLLRKFAPILLCAIGLEFVSAGTAGASETSKTQIVSGNKSDAIPCDQIGVKAGADYHGDGLSIVAVNAGAHLHCVFQRMDGDATFRGLWLNSTLTNQSLDRFRVKAAAIGDQLLVGEGTVTVDGQTVRFTRPALVEEYSVSINGIRQDFLVTEKPTGGTPLKLQLSVTGAQVESTAYGAQLILEKSNRKIAYSRLHATDAQGKDLPVQVEVPKSSAFRNSTSAIDVVVDDVDAIYPVRIDPTFSDANWASMGSMNGTDGNVYATVIDSLGNLYIGGKFTVAGNVIANNIAKWNGTTWSALGLGVNNKVDALAVSGTNLFASGKFTTATNSGNVAATVNYVAKWDGSHWWALGSGVNGEAFALTVSGGTLYAGGLFTTAGGNAANRIAQWNGSSWSALGAGMNYYVYALAISGGTLYAGGGFTTAGGNTANSIAQWNGSSWSAMGTGMNNVVYAIVASGGTLYASGSFTTAGGNTANCIAQWNGSNWSSLGTGMNYTVYALAVSGSTLYAGGSFTTAGGSVANYIAQWNGSSWSTLGPGMNSQVNALATAGGTLYAGGDFPATAGNAVNYIAQWNGSSWSTLGSGLSGGFSPSVYALAVSGTNLYVGGYFTTTGSNAVNYIAHWNGNSWSTLGAGMNDYVSALAVSGGTLYAGGVFTMATNSGNVAVTVNHIAQWNGSSWLALGSGMNSNVMALAVSNNTLYAGGSFTTAGGNVANYTAQWDGSSWSALGSGMNANVTALAISGTNLYAGGSFTTAGGSSANHIAQWDGSSWTPLALGVNGPVYAIATSVSNLYAGGSFTTAGGTAATNIALWNGSSWSTLNSGMNNQANALTVSGSVLYVGGGFTSAGGNTANYIAQWNGKSWSALGSGLNYGMTALAVSGGVLYAGGYFTVAGGKVSVCVAKATIGPPTILSQPQSTNVAAGSSANFLAGADGQPLSYQWFKNGNRLSDGGNVLGSLSNSLALTNVSVNDPGYYLVMVTNNFGSATSTVATLTVSNLPFALRQGSSYLGYTSNQFWLTILGPAGSNAVVYASTNLQTWVPLATNPLSLGSLTYTDLLATNYPNRFYRAQLTP